MTADAKQIFSEWLKHDLFQQALRHRSAGMPHNERLEFVGDAVLDLVMARRLYDAFPDLPEGDLTLMRSRLVCDRRLAEVAREIGLGHLLILGRSEESDGRDKVSILAGALEAVVGAVYVLAGLEAADKTTAKIFADRIEGGLGDLRDAKTRLQEHLHAAGLAPPDYQTEQLGKKDPVFSVRCRVGEHCTEGEAGSKKVAGQLAAERMLSLLADA